MQNFSYTHYTGECRERKKGRERKKRKKQLCSVETLLMMVAGPFEMRQIWWEERHIRKAANPNFVLFCCMAGSFLFWLGLFALQAIGSHEDFGRRVTWIWSLALALRSSVILGWPHQIYCFITNMETIITWVSAQKNVSCEWVKSHQKEPEKLINLVSCMWFLLLFHNLNK